MTHLPGSLKYRIALALALVLLAGMLGSQPAPREQVGPLPGGGFLLNSGWRLDPVGRQVPLDTLPMSTALSPDGKYLLVLNGGYRPPSVSVIETASGRVTGSVPVADGWLGLAISPKGDRFTWAGAQRLAIRIRFRQRRPHARANLRGGAAGAARRAGFHRRCCLFAGRPPALRGQPVSRQHLGGQPAIGYGDRPVQNRAAPVPHSIPSRWQELLRHATGRMARVGQYDAAGGSLIGQAGPRRRACQRYGVARRRAGDRGGRGAALHGAHLRGSRQHQSGLRPGRDRRPRKSTWSRASTSP